jgi:cell division initiation protein
MPFSKKLRGYDPQQVDAAIAKLTFDAEESAQNAERVMAELDRQKVTLEDLRQNHDQLSRALVSAHKAADDIRSAAETKAQVMMTEARQRAEDIVREAEEAVRVIEADIDSLIKRRSEAEQSYATFVESLAKSLESIRSVEKPSLTSIP